MLSNILFTPSSNETFGTHFKSFLIFFTSANVISGSPGLLGNLTTPTGFNNFTSSLTDLGFPDPKFHILFIFLVSDALKKALATSVTYKKSLLCFPFPTTVRGFLTTIALKKHQILPHKLPLS